MEKFILNVGLNDKNTKTQKISTEKAYTIIHNILLEYVDGATLSQNQGLYKHDNGNKVIENSITIELLFTNKDTVEKIADKLKQSLNQEKIAISKQVLESYLY